MCIRDRNNAKSVDAQASYETQLSLWPAVMAHANLILHSAGWLEAGLVCSLEKFIIDVEGLAVMQRLLDGIVIDEETLALPFIAEVGPGGHHLGTAHTLARYRSEFYMPIVSDRQNYDKWREDGSHDAARRAHAVAGQLLAAYEPVSYTHLDVYKRQTWCCATSRSAPSTYRCRRRC